MIVGTAGHIDHGKTALVKALTGIDADRLPEEKRRGITVDLGFAEMTADDVHFGFVDVPGHERFVKNMLAGASGIDLVLFVVAADEGVMPQTREHFDICRLLGVRSGLIALTKSDVVDEETLELARLDVAELITGSFLENAHVVPVSSRTGAGIDELKEKLVAEARASAAAEDDRGTKAGYVTRLPIDRSFSMKGFGAVVTGTLASGEIKTGSEMELLPRGVRVRVRGLQTHGRLVETAYAGQRVAINLAGIDHHDIERGMTLVEPATLRATQVVDTHIEVLPTSPRPLRSRQRVRLHLGTAEVLARVAILGQSTIEPGNSAFVQLRLESSAVAVTGERFIIRSYSPQMTIAGGEVIDPLATRHRSSAVKAVVDRLGIIMRSDEQGKIRELIASTGTSGVDTRGLQARTGFDAASLTNTLRTAVADGSIVAADDRYLEAALFDQLKKNALNLVEAFHRREPLASGVPIDELRTTIFGHAPEQISRAALSSLTAENEIAIDKDTVRSATHRTELSSAETAFINKLDQIYSEAGLEVPKLSEAVAEATRAAGISSTSAEKLLRLQLSSGRLVKVSNEFAYSGRVISGLINKVREYAAGTTGRAIDVAIFKDLAGVSRKYAIPLLEYLDGQKVTARVGDKRVVI